MFRTRNHWEELLTRYYATLYIFKLWSHWQGHCWCLIWMPFSDDRMGNRLWKFCSLSLKSISHFVMSHLFCWWLIEFGYIFNRSLFLKIIATEPNYNFIGFLSLFSCSKLVVIQYSKPCFCPIDVPLNSMGFWFYYSNSIYQ